VSCEGPSLPYNDTRILGLEVAEREAILRVLEDPRAGLEELCAVHVGRLRDGL
jgi:hypothetical protein